MLVQAGLYLDSETVSCRLVQRIARMKNDWNLRKLDQPYQVYMLYLQDSPKNYYGYI